MPPKLNGSAPKKRSLKKQVVPSVRKDPISDIGIDLNEVIYFSSHISSSTDLVLRGTKAFSEIPSKDCRNAFIIKCHECAKRCDFSSQMKDQKAKNIKSHLLQHLALGFSESKVLNVITPEVINFFFQAMEANIIREFPLINMIEPNAKVVDLAWPHVSLAYVCMHKFLGSTLRFECPVVLLNGIVRNLVAPDQRERSTAKTIVTSVYQHEQHSRKIINSCVIDLVKSKRCSPELFNFFLTTIGGYPTPLPPDAIALFYDNFLPIHLVFDFPIISDAYIASLQKFIAKYDPLVNSTVEYVIKHWPCNDQMKQTLFLRELAELVSMFGSKVSTDVFTLFWKKVADCVGDVSIDISEEALKIIMKEKLADNLREHADTLYPLFAWSLSNASQHWSQYIQSLSSNVTDYLAHLNSISMKRATEMIQLMKSKKRVKIDMIRNKWEKIKQMAENGDATFILHGLSIFNT